VAQPLRHAWFAGMRVADLIPDREALISPDFYKRRNQLVQNRIATLRAQGFTAEQIQALQRAEQLPEDMALSTELIARQQQVPVAGPEGKAPTATPMSDVEIQAMRERFKEARNPVERVRGFADQINWEYAVIQRLNKAELKTELISFNLAKAVIDKDPAHNLQLQPDDVITVMNSADLRLPVARQTRLVRIEGEVASPGVYQALPGETLPQLIARAGGLTPQAYLYGAEFTRESVRKQQQQNLDQVIRRLESQMQSAGATLAANLTGERALQSQALQQQQQQQMQAQISRLKTLRSKGRVALELDASVSKLDALPALPLEDGDALTIPSMPAFVSAAGSVNNENVMIYRPGKTVGDVLKAAGLAEDAEPNQAFVLRADGSVLSRSNAGWLSSFEGAKVMPGDTLVVPPKVDRESSYNFLVRGLRDWTQIFSNLGIGAAAIKTLRN
jgi:protein involved in polysaccharide export with SLBB domain